jgi:hypothetical protein
MNEVKCDNCGEMACGDECDGKSHATTERTCETCKADCINQGTRPHGLVVSKPNCPDYKHLPAAQDADELKPCPNPFGKDGPHRPEVTRLQPFDPRRAKTDDWDFRVACQCGTWGDIFPTEHEAIAFWNRRPSRPMSAEVEKAIETIRTVVAQYIDRYFKKQRDSVFESLDLIVAALKEKV